MEEPNRQVHLGCTEDYAKQLFKFFDFRIIRRSSIKLDHPLHDIQWVISCEIFLDVRFMLDWVGDGIEIPLLRKIPNDDITHPVVKETTRQTSSTLPSHGIWRI